MQNFGLGSWWKVHAAYTAPFATAKDGERDRLQKRLGVDAHRSKTGCQFYLSIYYPSRGHLYQERSHSR